MVDRLSNERTRVLAPIKCQRKLGEDISVVGPGQLISHDDLGIEVIFAYNPPRKAGITYHRKGECVGYVLEIEGKRIYHAGDTGLIEEMSGLGRIDLALLPIGGRFTMDIDEAVEAVKIINPALVVPMHMLKADPHKFRELVEEKTSSQAKVLAPGEKLELEN
jgi:L-ascorbate metabolism protein UlaG (beta-lactamase superfamily)